MQATACSSTARITTLFEADIVNRRYESESGIAPYPSEHNGHSAKRHRQFAD